MFQELRLKKAGERERERAGQGERECLLLDFKMTGIGLHVIKKENQRECERLHKSGPNAR